MRMAADGNTLSSTVTSRAHLIATENRLPTKKTCFPLNPSPHLRRPGGVQSDACAESESRTISVNDAKLGSVGN